jgi:hypothetical protein
LREVYPRFAEVLALYGDEREPRGLGGDRAWRSRAFDGCPYFELTPGVRGRAHREVIGNFEPVSARCWELVVPEFGGPTLVEVKVDAPPGGTAIADLSAAVAGRPIQADTAIVEAAAGTRQLSARWIVELPHDRHNVFVLANVARDPAATTRMQNLPITFTALETRASVSVSGGGGSGTSGSARTSNLPTIPGGPALGFEATS